MAHSSFRTKLSIFRYHFTHWFFSWRLDSEGDMGLLIANMLFLVKYKEHTIVSWLNPFKTHELRLAPKHGGSFNNTAYYNYKTSFIHFSAASSEFSRMVEGYFDAKTVAEHHQAEAYFNFEREVKVLKVAGFAVKDVELDKVVAIQLKGIDDGQKATFARAILDRYSVAHENSVILPTHS